MSSAKSMNCIRVSSKRKRCQCVKWTSAADFGSVIQSKRLLTSRNLKVRPRRVVSAYMRVRGVITWQCDRMENLAEYHGPISKKQAEEVLNEAGRDGSYLIRDSMSSTGRYCICVLCDGWVYTYRIFKQKDGHWTIEVAPGVKERLFRNVRNLIAAFKLPNQGISIPLLYPVNRPKQ